MMLVAALGAASTVASKQIHLRFFVWNAVPRDEATQPFPQPSDFKGVTEVSRRSQRRLASSGASKRDEFAPAALSLLTAFPALRYATIRGSA
jgi:hypothetical protein